jgi:hypothetical protein
MENETDKIREQEEHDEYIIKDYMQRYDLPYAEAQRLMVNLRRGDSNAGHFITLRGIDGTVG